MLDHELTSYYGMQDLSPASFDLLSDRFRTEEDLALKYQKTKSQQGNKGYNSCDDKCRLEVYCDTQTSSYDDSRICQGYPRVDIIGDPVHAINTEFM